MNILLDRFLDQDNTETGNYHGLALSFPTWNYQHLLQILIWSCIPITYTLTHAHNNDNTHSHIQIILQWKPWNETATVSTTFPKSSTQKVIEQNFHVHSFYGENNTATLSIPIFNSYFEVEELEQWNTLFSTNNLISTSIKVGLYYSHSKNQRGKIRYLKSE